MKPWPPESLKDHLRCERYVKNELTTKTLFSENTYCPLLPNMGNSGAWVYFLAKYLENTFRDETMAENGDKNEFITKEI